MKHKTQKQYNNTTQNKHNTKHHKTITTNIYKETKQQHIKNITHNNKQKQ